MKVLQKYKGKDYTFTRKDLEREILKENNLRVCLVKDLKVGLKYIKISQNLVLLSDIKKENFKEQIIKIELFMMANKQKELEYKKDIKHFCKTKELFIFAL